MRAMSPVWIAFDSTVWRGWWNGNSFHTMTLATHCHVRPAVKIHSSPKFIILNYSRKSNTIDINDLQRKSMYWKRAVYCVHNQIVEWDSSLIQTARKSPARMAVGWVEVDVFKSIWLSIDFVFHFQFVFCRDCLQGYHIGDCIPDDATNATSNRSQYSFDPLVNCLSIDSIREIKKMRHFFSFNHSTICFVFAASNWSQMGRCITGHH